MVVAILAGLALYLRHRVQEMFASAQTEVLSQTVATGTIHTTVSGDGVLAEVDEEALTVPAGVEITEVKAKAGDIVSQGDLLATVDVSSVMSALSNIQDDIKSLDSDLSDAKDDTISSNITTRFSGRVKALYGEPDMDVTACMAEHGALDLLSLDGKMAVDIETEGWKIVLLSNVESTCTGDENCPLDHDSPNHLPECIGACDRSADCDATVHDKNCIKSCTHADNPEDCPATVHYSDCIEGCLSAQEAGQCKSGKHTLTKKRPLTLKRRVLSYSICRGG